MKHSRLLAFVALTFAATAPPAGAAAPCRIPGGRVLKTGAIARLISVPTPGGAALYACIRRSGRKVVLDDGDVDAESVRLAGRRVAWVSGGIHRAAVIR